MGTTTATHTIQDHAKLKVAYEVSPQLTASYTLGWWDNDAQRSSASYLRDAAGNAVYSGRINVDGRRYTVTPADFAPTAGDLRHLMQGLSLKTTRDGAWNFELAASDYDYDRDFTRSPTVALPAAATGGAGRLADQHGTGWSTLALRAMRRPATDAGHILDLGIQLDDYRLRTLVSNADDWRAGAPTTRLSAFRGDTELASVYAQDTWAFAPQWRATLGARVERWRAANGALGDATTTLGFAERSATYVSPKFALARQLTAEWSLKASLGRAVRLPTVAELYQGSIAANVVVNNDPNLRPEKFVDVGSGAASAALARGSLRLTAFFEETNDALYSQTNVTVTPNVTNMQNVDEIDTRGLETAFQAIGLLGDRLDLSASLTYAHSRIESQRELSRERRQVAAARAGVARQCPRDVSARPGMVGDGGRPLQRPAVQHARQLGPERLRVHGHERVRRLRLARALRQRPLVGVARHRQRRRRGILGVSPVHAAQPDRRARDGLLTQLARRRETPAPFECRARSWPQPASTSWPAERRSFASTPRWCR